MSIQGGPDIVNDGLILHLDAANNRSYVSGSNIWYDLSDTKNHASLVNGPTFDSSTAKGCIYVDGVNDYIVTSKNINITGSASRTLMLTFNYFGGAGWGPIAEYGDGDCGGKMFGIGYFPYGNGIISWGGCSDLSAPSSLALQQYKWNFICSRTNGTTTSLMLNKNTYSGNQNFFTQDGPLYIGAETTAADGSNIRTRVSGRYGFIIMYNRYLSDAEVLQNYNATKGRFGL